MEQSIIIKLSTSELKSLILDTLKEAEIQKTKGTELPKYYTRQQVAELLHITLPTVHNLVNSGCLTAKKVGSRTLFDVKEVQKAIAEKKVLRYGRRN